MGKLKEKGTWLSGIIGAVAGVLIIIAACFGIITIEQKAAMKDAVVVVQDATVYTASSIDEIVVEVTKIKDELPKAEFEELITKIKNKDFGGVQELIGKLSSSASGTKKVVSTTFDSVKAKVEVLKQLASHIASKDFKSAKAIMNPTTK